MSEATQTSDKPALHPYWCDSCGEKSPFTIPGSPVEHEADCERHGEDPVAVYRAAVEYCRKTGKGIP